MKVRHDQRGCPRYRLASWHCRRPLAAILSLAVVEVLRRLSPFPEAFFTTRPWGPRPRLQATATSRGAGKDPVREVPGEKPQDLQDVWKQMFKEIGQQGGTGAPGSAATATSRGPGKDPVREVPGEKPQDLQDVWKQMFKEIGQQGGTGAPGSAGAMENPFAAMLGGAGAGRPPKKTSDMWFLNKFPVLKRIKRPVLIAFFAFCFYRGWVGRWGLIFGCMAGSYFDMLAVPLRVSDRSPFTGRAYVMTQIYVDYFFKLLGYIINVAKGKAKFPPDFSKMLTPPAGAPGAGANPFAPGANPFAAAGGKGENPFDMMNPFDISPVNQYQSPPVQPTDMPTAPTVGWPASLAPMSGMPLTVEPVPKEKKSPPARNSPPVVDADVTFLD